MQTALLRFTRWRAPASVEGRRRPAPQRFVRASRRQPGLGLPTGIALAMLLMLVAPISRAANAAQQLEAAGSEHREDKSSPASQFLAAYNSMATADVLKEKGMRTEAADLYAEALDLFLKISTDYPQWQPAVVAFRINYCREALGRKRDATNPSADGPGTESITKNESQETSNSAKLSPLNFKLQQAALKERGRDYTGALAMYIAILDEFPREPWALKGACRCCLRLGKMEKARELTQAALTLPLPDAELNLLAAMVDCYDSHYPTAITRLNQSLKQNNLCPEAHVALGVALAATGKLKEAQEEMKRALSLNPKFGNAYYNLARLSLRQKPTDHDTARVDYQNALRHGAAPDPELDKLLAE